MPCRWFIEPAAIKNAVLVYSLRGGQPCEKLAPQVLVALELSVHHVHLHHGMRVAHSAPHRAEVLAIDDDGHAEWLHDLFHELRDGMRGPLLVLQSPGKIAGDPRQLR